MRPQVGSLIGALGGLLFVLVNAGALPSGLVCPARVVGVIAFAGVLLLSSINTAINLIRLRGGTNIDAAHRHFSYQPAFR